MASGVGFLKNLLSLKPLSVLCGPVVLGEGSTVYVSHEILFITEVWADRKTKLSIWVSFSFSAIKHFEWKFLMPDAGS